MFVFVLYFSLLYSSLTLMPKTDFFFFNGEFCHSGVDIY